MKKPPKVIEELKLIDSPIDFDWESSLSHAGPMETVTKLSRQLSGPTGLGQLTLCCGVVEWGSWRLHGLEEDDTNLDLVEAAFAYQVDFRYSDSNAVKYGRIPDQPPARSALLQLRWFLCEATHPDTYWMSYYTPLMETFHSIHIVRHILPKGAKKAFTNWLEIVLDRVKTVAQKPKEPFRKKKTFDSPAEYEVFIARHRGEALPREILDPYFDYDHTKREELIERFLARLDWHANPYLRSPEEMKRLGFEGTPYKL